MQLLVIQNGARREVPVQDLKKGKDGNLQTLEVLIPMIVESSRDPALREFVLVELLAGCPPGDFDCEVKRLFEFARSIRYVDDPVDTEQLQYWRDTVSLNSGDCDDKAGLLASMLGSIGYVNRLVAVNYYDDLETYGYDHLYNELLKPDGSWMPLDATPRRGRAGQEAAAPVRHFFEIWPGVDEGVSGWIDDLVRTGIQTGVQLGTSYAQQRQLSSSQSRQAGQQFDAMAGEVTRFFDSIQAQAVITADDLAAAVAAFQQLAQRAEQYGSVGYIAEQWASSAYRPAYEARLQQVAARVAQAQGQVPAGGGAPANGNQHPAASNFFSSISLPMVGLALGAALLVKGRD